MAVLEAFSLPGFNPLLPPGVVVVVSPTPVIGGIVNSDKDALNLGEVVFRGGSPTNKTLSAVHLDDHGGRFWRNHWHLREQQYDLGLITSDQELTAYLHNAHRTPQDVTAIDLAGSTGVNLSDEGTPSFAVAAQTTVEYTITVDDEGDANLAWTATWTLDPSSAFSLQLAVTGTRALAWNFPPDMEEFTERLFWDTDIITSADGTEQRISVRNVPATEWEQRHTVDALDAQRLENFTAPQGADFLVLPVQIDEMVMTADVAIGASVINVEDTTNRDIAVGDQVMLQGGLFSFETKTIEALTDTTIEFASSPLLSAWAAADTRVFPARGAQIESVSGQVWRTNARRYKANFRLTEPHDLADVSAFTLYDGQPIWQSFDVWHIKEPLPRGFSWKLSTFDPGTGEKWESTLQPFAKISHNLEVHISNRADLWTFKAFLHWIAGKRQSFWIRSDSDDFPLQTDSTTNDVLVEDTLYSISVAGNTEGWRDRVFVWYEDGSFDYRQVVGASRVAGVSETLTFDSPLSQSFVASLVFRTGMLHRMRLASDTVEILHLPGGTAYANLPLMEVNN